MPVRAPTRVRVIFLEDGLIVSPPSVLAVFKPVYRRGGLAVDYATLARVDEALARIAMPVREGGAISYYRDGVAVAEMEEGVVRLSRDAINLLAGSGYCIAILLPGVEEVREAVRDALLGTIPGALLEMRVYPLVLPKGRSGQAPHG